MKINSKLFKKFGAMAWLSLICLESKAATIAWSDIRDDASLESHEQANGVAIDNQNNVIVTGEFRATSAIKTIKYDAWGSVVWEKDTYPGFLPSYQGSGHLVAIDSQQDVLVAGTVNVSGNSKIDIIVQKYDGATGHPEWSQPTIINGRASGIDVPKKILIDDANNIYLACEMTDGHNLYGFNDIVVLKVSGTTGQVVWRNLFRGTSPYLAPGKVDDRVGDFKIHPVNGLLLLVGYSDAVSGPVGPYPSQPIFSTYDPANGHRVTVPPFQFTQSGSVLNKFQSLAISPTGELAVVGQTHNGTDTDILVMKFSSSLVVQWWSMFDFANFEDRGVSIILNALGEVTVAGVSATSWASSWDLLFFGNPLPSLTSVAPVHMSYYTGPGVGGAGELLGMSQDASNGNLLLVGDSHQSSLDFVDLRYTSAGGALNGWPQYFGGPANLIDTAKAWVSDGNGNIFIVGSTEGLENSQVFSDWSVVKFGP